MFLIGAIQVTRDKFLIGRDPECHFRPNSPLVSRHHCVILKDEYTVRIRDLGSRNGTLVNSQPIHGDHVLNHDDVIVIGELTLQVFFEGVTNRGSDSDTTVTHTEPPTPAAATVNRTAPSPQASHRT